MLCTFYTPKVSLLPVPRSYNTRVDNNLKITAGCRYLLIIFQARSVPRYCSISCYFQRIDFASENREYYEPYIVDYYQTYISNPRFTSDVILVDFSFVCRRKYIHTYVPTNKRTKLIRREDTGQKKKKTTTTRQTTVGCTDLITIMALPLSVFRPFRFSPCIVPRLYRFLHWSFIHSSSRLSTTTIICLYILYVQYIPTRMYNAGREKESVCICLFHIALMYRATAVHISTRLTLTRVFDTRRCDWVDDVTTL